MTYQETYNLLELIAADIGYPLLHGNRDQFNKYKGSLPCIYLQPFEDRPSFPNNINIKHSYAINMAFLSASVRDTTKQLVRTGVMNLMHNKATQYLNKLKFRGLDYGDFWYEISNHRIIPAHQYNWNSRITGGVVLTLTLSPASTYDYASDTVSITGPNPTLVPQGESNCIFFEDATHFYHSCDFGDSWKAFKVLISNPNNEQEATVDNNSGQINKPMTIGELQSLTYS